MVEFVTVTPVVDVVPFRDDCELIMRKMTRRGPNSYTVEIVDHENPMEK
jgi:hypothetical protein